MGSIFSRFFARNDTESDDEMIGCDMVPSPMVLASLFDPQLEDDHGQHHASASALGPFTTIAQAPIRDS